MPRTFYTFSSLAVGAMHAETAVYAVTAVYAMAAVYAKTAVFASFAFCVEGFKPLSRASRSQSADAQCRQGVVGHVPELLRWSSPCVRE